MTADILKALWRSWYVAAFGIVATGLTMFLIAAHPGVYWAQLDIVFLAPRTDTNPNSLAYTSGSLIATAGLVEREVNKGVSIPATASSSVTLVGRGVRDGYEIRLPNNGGQWSNNYDRPVLDIQVVGGAKADVRRRLDQVIAKVETALVELQDRDNVAVEARITTQSAPKYAAIFHLYGQPKRALAVAALLGLSLTIVATACFDRVRANRRTRLKDVTAVEETEPSASV